MPSVAVYLDTSPAAIARAAASFTYSGVSMSGSPTPRSITFRPAARSALARVDTLMVADSLSSAMFSDGLNARALPVFREVVRESPGRAEAWSVLAFLHAQKGELSEAIPAFEQALALRPGDAALCFNAAFTLQRAGRHDEALALFLRAIDLDPKLDRAWYGLGLSLAHAGRYEEAVARFREAARLQPFNPYAGYHLAAALFKLGRRDEVLKEYERVKEFDPKISELMRREFQIGEP